MKNSHSTSQRRRLKKARGASKNSSSHAHNYAGSGPLCNETEHNVCNCPESCKYSGKGINNNSYHYRYHADSNSLNCLTLKSRTREYFFQGSVGDIRKPMFTSVSGSWVPCKFTNEHQGCLLSQCGDCRWALGWGLVSRKTTPVRMFRKRTGISASNWALCVWGSLPKIQTGQGWEDSHLHEQIHYQERDAPQSTRREAPAPDPQGSAYAFLHLVSGSSPDASFIISFHKPATAFPWAPEPL